MKTATNSKMQQRFIAAGLGLGVLIGSAGLVSALQTDTTTPPAGTAVPADDKGTDDPADAATEDPAEEANETHEGRGGMAEEVLTGQTATDVTAAAEAAAPGSTVDKVETNGRGDGYEAYVTAADGTQSKIHFDLDLNVVEQVSGRKGHGEGHGGEGHGRGGHDKPPLEATLAAELTAAAEAEVPGGTVESVSLEGNGSGAMYEAHVTDVDGNQVEVTFDADRNVLEVAQDG